MFLYLVCELDTSNKVHFALKCSSQVTVWNAYCHRLRILEEVLITFYFCVLFYSFYRPRTTVMYVPVPLVHVQCKQENISASCYSLLQGTHIEIQFYVRFFLFFFSFMFTPLSRAETRIMSSNFGHPYTSVH